MTPALRLFNPSPRRWTSAVFAASLLALILAAPAEAAPCAGSDLQGVVFHDYDADGARSTDNVEVGIGGAVVSVFANDGSSVSCETLADGAYGVDAPSGGFPVRVEVTLPAGFRWDALEPGAAGPTTAFFASGAATGLDVGFNVPLDYCQPNPDVLATCFLHGDPQVAGSLAADLDTIVSVDYDRTVPSPVHVAVGAQVGNVWGLAYQRSSNSLFAAAVLRRHAGFGPLGIGGIYRIDYTSGSPVVSNFVDVTSIGIPVGTDPRTEPGEDPPGGGPTGNEPGLDNLTYEQVGKVGLGDIDVDEATGALWAMSLGDRTLYRMDIGDDATPPTAATPFPLPAVSCTDGVFRPWAVKSHRGRIYIGGVCSNETISPYPAPGGVIDYPDLVGYIYSMDPDDGVFSLELTVPLNYRKGCSLGSSGCQWNPWTDLTTVSQVTGGNRPRHPTPILSDVEIADDGDLIVGFTDRTGLQYGIFAPAPNTTPTDASVTSVFAGGDMLRADYDPETGTYTLESNGIVGGLAGAGAGNLEGPGGGEYYSASTANIHFELSLGGYAVLRGSNSFVGSAMDPVTINSGGLLWMHEKGATPGARLGGYTLYASAAPPTFAKGTGIGDVELRCDPAPIEIGNRVWCDAPVRGQFGDGVQGPGAPDLPLGGVTVDLVCDGGGVVASTVTAADGTYGFNASNVAGGLPPGGACTLSIDTSQPALGDCDLPAPRDSGGADPGADLRDSDGGDPDGDGIVEVDFTLGGPGANDHSLDFGFVTAPTIGRIGDTVWCDGLEGFGDGIFTPGEGLAGISVTLFADDGCNDTADGPPLSTAVTSGDGQYLFTDLLVGPTGDPVCYVVRVDAADPDLGVCTLPITDIETTPDLDVDGPEDLDNDFGFVEPCVDPDGDRVCNESCTDDRDGDGVPDCDDYDPQGYFYCEDSGEILPGGRVEVSGPGAVTLFEDGSTGRYAFQTDGTPGTYTLLVTPPASYPLSSACPDQGILDPTGGPSPLTLGAGEIVDTGRLRSELCGDNPFYLTFELEPGDPFVINNNLPLASCAVPVVEIPTATEWGLGFLILLLALAGALTIRMRS